MYCTECGTRLNKKTTFCTNCGHPQVDAKNGHVNIESPALSVSNEAKEVIVSTQERWWHRLAKVFYYGMYLNLLWIIPLTWTENDGYYSGYGSTRSYVDTPDEAFFATLMTFIIAVVSWRAIKLVLLYIIRGQSVNWRKEFTSWF